MQLNAQYLGGSTDGASSSAVCSSTLAGVSTSLTISAISGSTVFCDNSNETYSVTLNSGTADSYLWTGPTGTTVSSQQIDGFANLQFGSTPGNITVVAGNSCATTTQILAVTNSACEYYYGGTDDGNSSEAACASTLAGVATGLTISPILGSSVFCDNNGETYSTTITTGAADYYLWTGPTGTTVSSQQIDGFANLSFGTTAGNVTVEVGNSCATATEMLAVTNSTCTFFNGAANDGSSSEAACASTLAGVATGLTISPILGSSVFCDNSGETYSTTVTAGAADYYLWTGPTGTTVSSQQIDGFANLSFGTTSGNVTVEVGNSCATATEMITVTNSTCTFFNGGTDDGSSSEAACASTLAGVATGLAISPILGSSVFCDNSGETYSTTVTAGAADYYLWTGPTGTTVSSQQVDGFANLLFGTTAGNITVEVGNSCATTTEVLAVTNSSCTFFNGGTDDGSSSDASCASTLAGITTGLAISPILGSSIFCNNSGETYSTTVTAGAAEYFLWTGPTGTTISSQQVEGFANLLFGTTAGNITVEVGNSCASVTEMIAVSNLDCVYFNGGTDDGSSSIAACVSTLDGTGTGLAISPITGSTVFCNNSAETYSTSLTSGSADYYLWTGPTGTTVASQQIDGFANLLFGTTAGNVTVEVGNSCANTIEVFAVTNSSCGYYFGGRGDGFAVDSSVFSTPLPIELTYFNAKLVNDIVELSWQTLSEINNDFFTIEKSIDARIFETVTTMNGAGNSNQLLNYATQDPNPFEGYSYYRLKQTDFDGQYSYSDVRPIYYSKNGKLGYAIFPNPSKGDALKIKLLNNNQEKISLAVTIYDALGGIVKQFEIIDCIQDCDIDALELNPGLYTIKINNLSLADSEVRRVIIN